MRSLEVVRARGTLRSHILVRVTRMCEVVSHVRTVVGIRSQKETENRVKAA